MKVLSWNIYMLPLLVPYRSNRRKRSQSIVAELLKLDFDIICFQEAFLPASRRLIWQGLHHLYPYQYGPANNGRHFKTNSGLWILSKVKLNVLQTVQFTRHTGWDSMARKGAMLLAGEWNGHPFHLLGTHLQAGVAHPKIREVQIAQLKNELLIPYRKPNVPQIICGDMNVSIDEKEEYQHMLTEMEAENGDIFSIEKLSYDGIHNTIARLRGAKHQFNYDYILIRHNGYKFNYIKRYVSILKQDDAHMSDHYGVVAELEF